MITVKLPFANRNGKPTLKALDLRDYNDVSDLYRWMTLWSPQGLREVLADLDALPGYALAWHQVIELRKELVRRLAQEVQS